MADKPQSNEVKPGMTEAHTPGHTPRVSAAIPTQRPGDARDAMATMAERAQVIGQEAGNKVASAMKDVIGAAAGLAGFAVESARDLLQYMVRRGQMSQDEADRLIRDAEDAQGKRSPTERGRASSARTPSERSGTREAATREPPPRADHGPTSTSSTARSAAAPKPAPPKKQASAAPEKPAKKTAAKTPSGDKKPATRKTPAAKKRR